MTDQLPAMPRRSSWRVAALGEADRLDTRLASALRGSDPAVLSAEGEAIRQDIAAARAIAKGKPSNWLLDWWYGTSIESAWQVLHRSQEELMMLLPAPELLAEKPYLRDLIQETFTGDRQKVETDALAESTADAPGNLAARRVLSAYHAKSDSQHQRARGLRNLVYVLFSGLTALCIALWGTGVASGETVGLGALAGAVSVAFAVRTGSPSGPYNLMLPQALLKVAAGSAVGLMAVKILDVTSGASVTTARDGMYAVVFGFSQQAFTRLVDQQAGALAKGPDARSKTAPSGSAGGA